MAQTLHVRRDGECNISATALPEDGLLLTALIDALVINITSFMQACKKYCGTWTNGVLKSPVQPATCIIRLKKSWTYRGKLTNATRQASTQTHWASRFDQFYDVMGVATLVPPDSCFATWEP